MENTIREVIFSPTGFWSCVLCLWGLFMLLLVYPSLRMSGILSRREEQERLEQYTKREK